MSTKTLLPIEFKDNKLILVDQRKLPHEEIYLEYTDLEGTFESIKTMVVRGAPCIGFTAIYGMALWIKNNPDFSSEAIHKAATYLKSARPTAVNLAFEIDRVLEFVKQGFNDKHLLYQKIIEFGDLQLKEAEFKNRKMASFAEQDLDEVIGKKKYRIQTHCNTGILACGTLGTALGVVQYLGEKDRIKNVWVDETRPYLQGARLTAFELSRLNIPHEIVVEGAASYLMKNGLVDAIFTGADRIVANGDTANKVGTSNLAILAKHYGIPFYIVAPSSTFDMSTSTGADIDIEMRDSLEVLEYNDIRVAPNESSALNPSFDITDGDLISGIISEKGIAKGDYNKSLKDII
jgi:methylthioribose-1-phosphate isomerase